MEFDPIAFKPLSVWKTRQIYVRSATPEIADPSLLICNSNFYFMFWTSAVEAVNQRHQMTVITFIKILDKQVDQLIHLLQPRTDSLTLSSLSKRQSSDAPWKLGS